MKIQVSARDVLTAATMLCTTSVKALDLPSATVTALHNEGITSLAHLARADISRVIGVGVFGEAKIRRAMSELGFTLEDSTLGLTVAQEQELQS